MPEEGGKAIVRTPRFSIEVITLPVGDVERALRFYADHKNREARDPLMIPAFTIVSDAAQ